MGTMRFVVVVALMGAITTLLCAAAQEPKEKPLRTGEYLFSLSIAEFSAMGGSLGDPLRRFPVEVCPLLSKDA